MELRQEHKDKVYSVIDSCTNREQLESAMNYITLFTTRYEMDPESCFIRSLIGLYNLKINQLEERD
jgi:hypothetical protein